MDEKEFTVTVSNIFLASNVKDAVLQMADWLNDYGYSAGYRVEWHDEVDGEIVYSSSFVDAEDVVDPVDLL